MSASDSPFPQNEVQYLVLTDATVRKTVVGIKYSAGYPQIAARGVFSGDWLDDDWLYFSTATKPQEFDLQLESGFSNHYCAKYCKTQEGMVTVALWIAGSGAANAETTIATLPEGFRPAELFRAAGIADTGTISSQNQCGITVNEYGQIAVQDKIAWDYVSAVFTFRAAG